MLVDYPIGIILAVVLALGIRELVSDLMWRIFLLIGTGVRLRLRALSTGVPFGVGNGVFVYLLAYLLFPDRILTSNMVVIPIWSGLLFGGFMALATSRTYRGVGEHLRLEKGRIKYVRSVTRSDIWNELFSYCKEALLANPKIRIKKEDLQAGLLTARTGRHWFGWGDRVTVQLEAHDTHLTKVNIACEPSRRSLISSRNSIKAVDKIVAQLQSR
jgi:hypothetical protein